jgi:hypothetical protein
MGDAIFNIGSSEPQRVAQNLCGALSMTETSKNTIRLRSSWVLETHLLQQPNTEAGALRLCRDKPAKVLAFLDFLPL